MSCPSNHLLRGVSHTQLGPVLFNPWMNSSWYPQGFRVGTIWTFTSTKPQQLRITKTPAVTFQKVSTARSKHNIYNTSNTHNLLNTTYIPNWWKLLWLSTEDSLKPPGSAKSKYLYVQLCLSVFHYCWLQSTCNSVHAWIIQLPLGSLKLIPPLMSKIIAITQEFLSSSSCYMPVCK